MLTFHRVVLELIGKRIFSWEKMIPVGEYVNPYIEFSGNLQFARLVILATGGILENIAIWLSSSIRRITQFSPYTKKGIHDEALYSDLLQNYKMTPFVNDHLLLEDDIMRKEYVWIMMNVIDFPKRNVIEWHFDAADQIFEPLCSQRMIYPDGRLLYRSVVGVISYLEPHLHCYLKVKRNSPIGNGDIHPITYEIFNEGVKEFFDGTLISPWNDIEITSIDEDPVIWKGDKRIFPSSSISHLTCPSVDVSDRSLKGITNYATLVSLHFPDMTSIGILTAIQCIKKEAKRMGNW
jgi:hypothetical protein